MNKEKKFNVEVYEEILKTIDTSKEREDFNQLTKIFKPSKSEAELQRKYETVNTHPLFMKPIEEYNRRMGTNFKRLDEVWDARMEDKIIEQFENFAEGKTDKPGTKRRPSGTIEAEGFRRNVREDS